MLAVLKPINLALAFLLELALLAAFAYWGFNTGDSTAIHIVLGIGVPVLVAVIWGIFMAPSSQRRLNGAAYLVVKVVLFGLGVAALVAAGQTTLGVVFAVVFVVNTILLYVWKQWVRYPVD